MADSVEEPWKSDMDLDIGDMGDADFERRTSTLSLQDTSGDPRAIAEALSEEWEISKNMATDRVVRLYLTHIIDQHGLEHLYDDYDVAVLIPPTDFEVEKVDIEYDGDTPTLTTSIPPTVKDMIDDLVEDDDIDVSSPADFLRQSVYWITSDEK